MTTGNANAVSEKGRTAESALLAGLGGRSLVLVGMMGAGKSSVGRRLAARLSREIVLERGRLLPGRAP